MDKRKRYRASHPEKLLFSRKPFNSYLITFTGQYWPLQYGGDVDVPRHRGEAINAVSMNARLRFGILLHVLHYAGVPTWQRSLQLLPLAALSGPTDDRRAPRWD